MGLMIERLAMDRRTMLIRTAAGGVGILAGCARSAWAAADAQPKIVSIVQYSAAGVRGDVAQVSKIVKTGAEWRRQLSPISFNVTRHAAT